MRVAIIAKSGPAAGRRIVLRGGQVARVGRTDSADFALPEDLELANSHFAVHCQEGTVMLRALTQDRETKINGSPVKQAELHHGDVIKAGATMFHIEIEGATKLKIENSDTPPSPTAEPNRNETLEIAKYIGLSEGAIELAKASIDPKQFGYVLIQSSMLPDALRWYAHTIPKPHAVQWACACVEELMHSERDSTQLSAYRAAMRWGREPNDDNREDAKQLAEIAKYEGVGGILAAAAGWSGGSLGPSDIPEVPPDERTTAQCLCIALTIASNLGSPAGLTERLKGYIDQLPPSNAKHATP